MNSVVEIKNHFGVPPYNHFFQRRPEKRKNAAVNYHTVIVRNRGQAEHPSDVTEWCKKQLRRQPFRLDGAK